MCCNLVLSGDTIDFTARDYVEIHWSSVHVPYVGLNSQSVVRLNLDKYCLDCHSLMLVGGINMTDTLCEG